MFFFLLPSQIKMIEIFFDIFFDRTSTNVWIILKMCMHEVVNLFLLVRAYSKRGFSFSIFTSDNFKNLIPSNLGK